MSDTSPASIIGKQSPEFVADIIVNGAVDTVNSLDFYGKYILFFFYEADFSLVCPTEMFALQDALPEFKKRNVDIVAVSVDSIQTHLAWLKVPRSEGGIEGITFMLLSDIHKTLSQAYCILDEERGYCLRGTFLVDRAGIVQYGSVNTYAVGRSVSALLRIIDALQFTETHGELCPMDWKPGTEAIKVSFK